MCTFLEIVLDLNMHKFYDAICCLIVGYHVISLVVKVRLRRNGRVYGTLNADCLDHPVDAWLKGLVDICDLLLLWQVWILFLWEPLLHPTQNLKVVITWLVICAVFRALTLCFSYSSLRGVSALIQSDNRWSCGLAIECACSRLLFCARMYHRWEHINLLIELLHCVFICLFIFVLDHLVGK